MKKLYCILAFVLLLSITGAVLAAPAQQATVFDAEVVRRAAEVLPDSTVLMLVIDLRAVQAGDLDAFGELFNISRVIALNSYGGELPPTLTDLLADGVAGVLTSVYQYMRDDDQALTLADVDSWLGDYMVVAVNLLPEAPYYPFMEYSDPALATPVPSATPDPDDPYSVFYANSEQLRLRHEVIVLVESRDDSAASEFVQQQRGQWEKYQSSTLEEYPLANGGMLYVAPRYGDGYQVRPFGTLPGFVAHGLPESLNAVQRARTGEQPSLARSARYQTDLARLPGDNPLFTLWVDLDGDSEALYNPYPYDVVRLARERALVEPLLGGVGFSARLFDDGAAAFDFTYRGRLPLAMPAAPGIIGENGLPRLAQVFPQETLLVAESNSLALAFNYGYESLRTMAAVLDDPDYEYDLSPQQLDAGLAFINAQIGVDLQELFGMMDGNYALGIIESADAFALYNGYETLTLPYSVVLVVETASADAAEDVYDLFTDLLLTARLNPRETGFGAFSGSSIDLSEVLPGLEVAINYAPVGNLFVLSTGDGIMRIIETAQGGANLTQTASWTQGFAHAASYGDLVLYYNNEDFFRTLRRSLIGPAREGVEQAYILFENLGVVTFTGEIVAPDAVTASLFLTPR